MAKILLTDAEYGDLDIERELIEKAGHQLVVPAEQTADAIVEAGAEAEALLVQFFPVDRALLERLPRVRVISRYGVGVDNIDLQAAAAAEVCVANVPDYGVHEVATHAATMGLSLLRGLASYHEAVRDGRWDIQAAGTLPDPRKVTVGLLGLGRIGRKAGEILAPSVGRVLGYDATAGDGVGLSAIERVDTLQELVSRSNLISVHVPLVPATLGVIGARELAAMPRPSYVVNTARGGIVDEAAMLAALQQGRLDGAALDVLSVEPPDDTLSGLIRHPRVLVSPHVAWLSDESITRLRAGAVHNLLEWLEHGSCRNALPVAGRTSDETSPTTSAVS